jgi:tetraacyldisaccharide 4'-kinase
MKAPAFWSAGPGVLAWLLSPLGWVYGLATAWRMGKPGRKAELPVICIGNLTAGGAGKTPTVLMLAKALGETGEKPFVVSRGYGGRLAGPVRVVPSKMSAADCGDEPLLLARHVPTIVSRDRLAGAQLAQAEGATLVLLDDGLQNPGLRKDFSIVVIDSGAMIGNGFCIPAGPLRAPVGLQMIHGDAVIVVGDAPAGDVMIPPDLARSGKPLFHAAITADAAVIARLQERPVLAFAGIGRPEKFFNTLRVAGIAVAATRVFADHHVFSAAELAELRREAAQNGWQLVTTEKDLMRLPQQTADIVPLPITLDSADPALLDLLQTAIAHRRSVPSDPASV